MCYEICLPYLISRAYLVTSLGSRTLCASRPVDLDLALTSAESAASTRSRPARQRKPRTGNQEAY